MACSCLRHGVALEWLHRRGDGDRQKDNSLLLDVSVDVWEKRVQPPSPAHPNVLAIARATEGVPQVRQHIELKPLSKS